MFSHVVDYAEHYLYSDLSLSMFNFYRFSERQWRWWNPQAHYQNRLRHSDMLRKFSRLPLAQIDVATTVAGADSLASLPIAPAFGHYSESDLLTP